MKNPSTPRVRLTEVLRDLGRPLVLYPRLSAVVGGTKANVLLCQLVYWTGRGGDPNGWIWKGAEEIEEETGLTYREQTRARLALRSKGLLAERKAPLEHRLYFRVELAELDRLWYLSTRPNVVSGNDQTSVRETTDGRFVLGTELTSDRTPDQKQDARARESFAPKRTPPPPEPLYATVEEEIDAIWNSTLEDGEPPGFARPLSAIT